MRLETSMAKNLKICGIDYGSKMAGTTSICYLEGDEIKVLRSVKNQDADQMILSFCASFQPDLIAIDAPLSLPGVFRNLKGYDNYFYRKCDQALKAMSPMFIGGLTARAMKLKSQLTIAEVIEAYPVYRGKSLGLEEFGYRSKSADYSVLIQKLGFEQMIEIRSSHDLDALITYEIACRYKQGKSSHVGDAAEGLIYY